MAVVQDKPSITTEVATGAPQNTDFWNISHCHAKTVEPQKD